MHIFNCALQLFTGSVQHSVSLRTLLVECLPLPIRHLELNWSEISSSTNRGKKVQVTTKFRGIYTFFYTSPNIAKTAAVDTFNPGAVVLVCYLREAEAALLLAAETRPLLSHLERAACNQELFI